MKWFWSLISVGLDSPLNKLSIESKITKIGLRSQKLWPFFCRFLSWNWGVGLSDTVSDNPTELFWNRSDTPTRCRILRQTLSGRCRILRHGVGYSDPGSRWGLTASFQGLGIKPSSPLQVAAADPHNEIHISTAPLSISHSWLQRFEKKKRVGLRDWEIEEKRAKFILEHLSS